MARNQIKITVKVRIKQFGSGGTSLKTGSCFNKRSRVFLIKPNCHTRYRISHDEVHITVTVYITTLDMIDSGLTSQFLTAILEIAGAVIYPYFIRLILKT